jgi:hypothetical protein
MFFVASKLFWIFFSPVSVLLIAALIGAWQSKGRFPRTGQTIALAAILILIVAAMTPLGMILVSPLGTGFRHRRRVCRRPTESLCWAARSTARPARREAKP